ncbi:cupredoxin domain-containing protein [Pseudalkalibacillus sp. R45]|uniref:cupredoxin domain-containing protein n=1 Tax=Pseudalkalibacillus sp. R45 TaxID=3457433 RepID=UPI003FCD7033
MINHYTKFAATLFLLQVVTIIFSGAFILRHFPPIHLMNAVLSLIIAILLFKIKWKWIPSIGILYGLLFTILTIPSLIISMTRNIDPEYNAMLEASNPFIGISFLSALSVVTILFASIAGLVTNFHPNHQVPIWFPKVKGAVYGATIMGLFISFYLQLHWVTGINANTIKKLPTIVMKPDSVEPANMELMAGEPIVLQIRNESENKCHILSFPELNTSVHMEKGRTGLIVVDPEPGTYVYECKSHHDYYSDKIKGELTVVPK